MALAASLAIFSPASGFAQPAPPPAAAPGAEPDDMGRDRGDRRANRPESGARARCRAEARAGGRGDGARDRLQVCMLEARLACLKDAIAKGVRGAERRDFIRNCAA